jgi:serine/threonine protein kinase
VSPELHQRVRKLFEEAIEKPEGQRLAFLKAACPNDLETYQGVVEMLGSLTTTTSILQDPTRRMQHIGRYVLAGELGRGAMGVVYEATDPLIGRNVAVKIIHLQLRPDSKEAEFMRDRLFREARAAGRLFHPGIVVILDVGQEGDIAFIAMERVDGPTLEKTLVSQRRLKLADSLDILRQVAAALDYAHQNGVVHRDIKPANIMLHKGTTVKVADFGIAKSLLTEHGSTTGTTGMILGTPSYMSPEQIEALPVSGRSDQFSLAVVAYELLSGDRPFQGDSLATLAHMIVYGDRPSIRSMDPTLPPGLDEVLHRGLARKPELRYESCTQFVAALDEKLNQLGVAEDADWLAVTQQVASPIQEISATASPRIARKRRSESLWYVGAAGAALVILDLLLFYFRAAPPVHRVPVVSGQPATVAKASPAAQKFTPPPSRPANTISPQAHTNATSPPPATSRVTKSPVTAPPATPPPPPVDKQALARQLYSGAGEKLRAGKPKEAVKLFLQAADLGEPRAMQDLGEILLEGTVVDKNEEEAARWFRKAADKGNTSSMLFLGGMYRLGNGVEQSDQDAANWFRKAADAGNAAAMYNLGTLYEEGSGVPRDLRRAKKLYQDAATLGDQEAQKRLDQLR